MLGGLRNKSKKKDKLPKQISRYLIEREIGSGGFGTVYLSRDSELKRPVAIKLFRPDRDLGAAPERETTALARLEHPGIVPIYDTGNHEGRPFFVARYIPGPTLTETLRTRTFSPAESAKLIAQICDAVEHAHSRGVIIRDLKPSNIILH